MNINPLTAAGGAEITGVNLSAPLTPAVIAEIRKAFLEYSVIADRISKTTTRFGFATIWAAPPRGENR
jgi:hypothetical protein